MALNRFPYLSDHPVFAPVTRRGKSDSAVHQELTVKVTRLQGERIESFPQAGDPKLGTENSQGTPWVLNRGMGGIFYLKYAYSNMFLLYICNIILHFLFQ